MPLLRFRVRHLALAWLAATLLSGLPSTVYALLTAGDPFEATRAAGLMLLPGESEAAVLLAAAALVHGGVSLFWSLVLGLVLPRRHLVAAAVSASALIALLDLGIIAPVLFPAVAALAFWPQFADHLAWGAVFGTTLALCARHRDATSGLSG